jgi:hypothetical protein
MIIVCVFILISGFCIDGQFDGKIEFISTQMGACLDKYAYVTHLFVLGIAIQAILLFDSFLRCISSVAGSSKNILGFKVSQEQIASFCGVLIINFVTDMAGVAEFRSEGKRQREQAFHYYAAAAAIITFWSVHLLICVYLRRFAHTPDYKYVCMNHVYLCLTVLFIALWLGQLGLLVLSEVAMVIEWTILFIGLLLQCYAEYSLTHHTLRGNSKVNILRRTLDCKLTVWVNLASVLFNFIGTCVVIVLTAPPWFLHRNIKEGSSDKPLNTGPVFWLFVIAANVVVAMRLLWASFVIVSGARDLRSNPITCVDFLDTPL